MRQRRLIPLDNGTRVARGQIERPAADEKTMSDAIHYDRRHFIGTAATAIAGTGLLASRLGDTGRWSRDASSLNGATPSANGPLGQTTQANAALSTFATPKQDPPMARQFCSSEGPAA